MTRDRTQSLCIAGRGRVGGVHFPGGSVVKNPHPNAGATRVMGSIPGSGKSPGGGMTTHFSILAWEIPWT